MFRGPSSFSEEGSRRSTADIVAAESQLEVWAFKKQAKAAAKAAE
ncbi:Fe-S cluster assembly protein HesB [Nocardia seriolae]|nr:Fe-S cluster assembly protein HesB [Nocardia seriolae]